VDDSSIRLPLSIIVSVASGLATFFAAWGAFRARFSSLEKRVEKVEVISEKHSDSLNSAKQEVTRAAQRISDIAELKETAVTKDLFAIRMSAQDDALHELRLAIDRKVSISSMPRVEPESSPGVPGPRPRLPSRPGR
jgi:hypothetical protein